VERDEQTIDWDAAFEALVAPLRPNRYLSAARRAGQVAAALALLVGTGWVLISLVVESLHDLGRPWL
jgi:hypothetical protein